MNYMIFTLGWIGGGSTMWLYLRFIKHIRSCEEPGASYNCDTTEFLKFVKSYFSAQGREVVE